MAEMMNFPDDWHDFIKSNSFVDREKIYTNGARLMTELRVEQLVEHILREKEQQWVSVKDRMPKDGIFVLVCNDDGHMMLAKWESEAVRWEYKYMNYDWDVWDEEEQGPICYWMPLPEPPKEDEE